jgi:carboxypeptidase Q
MYAKNPAVDLIKESIHAPHCPVFSFLQDPLEYNSRTHPTNVDVYDRLQEDDLIQAAIV